MAAISQPSLPFDAALRSASPSGERNAEDPDARLPAPSLVEGKTSRSQVESYVFVRHPRARRYLIRVRDDGTVRVTVPRWGSKREAEAFATRERAWIEDQLRRADAERARRDRERDTANGAFGDDPTADHLRALRQRAMRELPPRLLELAARHGLAVSRISIRNQRSRWGSCSRHGHICLNWRLVTMPEMVRDYVLIHELMHLKRMDHSPKFWTLVADACPEYQDARLWLRHAQRV